MSYKKDLVIDKFNLDDAWEDQALKFCEWAEKAVEAAFERDKAKENLDVVRAELDGKIRSNAIEAGEKITETAISNKIILDKKYQEANQQVIDAMRNVGILNVAREAFDHRKKALEKLTDLHLSSYWSEPKEGKITKEVREDKDKKEHLEGIGKALMKRRSK